MSALAAAHRGSTRSEAWSDVRAGVTSIAPLVVAYVPFALVIGTVLAEHGGIVVGVVGTWMIFGGSAHLATVRSVEEGGVAAAVVTGLLVNARLIVYSAGLARTWRDQPRWFRVAAAPLVIDPTWALAEREAPEPLDPAARRRRFLAAGLALGVGFSSTVAAGMVVGGRIPTTHLGIAVPLCLLAMVGPSLRRGDDARAVGVAATIAWLTATWPSGTGLLAAIVGGAVAGRSWGRGG
jgi:predicted branched-subunit amino acid permease